MSLEVEVANENAKHWQDNLKKAHAANSALRGEVRLMVALLRRVQKLVTDTNVDCRTPELREEADNLMAAIRQGIGTD